MEASSVQKDNEDENLRKGPKKERPTTSRPEAGERPLGNHWGCSTRRSAKGLKLFDASLSLVRLVSTIAGVR